MLVPLLCRFHNILAEEDSLHSAGVADNFPFRLHSYPDIPGHNFVYNHHSHIHHNHNLPEGTGRIVEGGIAVAEGLRHILDVDLGQLSCPLLHYKAVVVVVVVVVAVDSNPDHKPCLLFSYASRSVTKCAARDLGKLRGCAPTKFDLV